MIEGLSYRFGKICLDHIELYDRWNPEHEQFFESNYVLLGEDAMAWFKVRECSLDSQNALTVASSR